MVKGQALPCIHEPLPHGRILGPWLWGEAQSKNERILGGAQLISLSWGCPALLTSQCHIEASMVSFQVGTEGQNRVRTPV